MRVVLLTFVTHIVSTPVTQLYELEGMAARLKVRETVAIADDGNEESE